MGLLVTRPPGKVNFFCLHKMMIRSRDNICSSYLNQIEKKAKESNLRKQRLQRTRDMASFAVLFLGAAASVISVYDIFSSHTSPAQYTYIVLTFSSTLIAGYVHIFGYDRRIHQHSVISSNYKNFKSILEIITKQEDPRAYSTTTYNLVVAFASVLGMMDATTSDSQLAARYPTGAIMMRGEDNVQKVSCDDSALTAFRNHHLLRDYFERIPKVHGFVDPSCTDILYCPENTNGFDLARMAPEWLDQFHNPKLHVLFNKTEHDGKHYLVEVHKIYDSDTDHHLGFKFGAIEVSEEVFAMIDTTDLQNSYARIGDPMELDELNLSVP